MVHLYCTLKYNQLDDIFVEIMVSVIREDIMEFLW